MAWTLSIVQNTDVRNLGTATATWLDAGGAPVFSYTDQQLRFKNDTATTNFANRARSALATFLADLAEDDATKAPILAKLNAP